MTVALDGEVIRLVEECRVEEAEELLRLLLASSDRIVDLSQCRQMHAAVAQVLLSLSARVAGEPADPFLRQFVAPNFKRLEE